MGHSGHFPRNSRCPRLFWCTCFIYFIYSEIIELPAAVVLLLRNILEAIASGRGVTIIPDNAELTTVQAADVLNVSRPYLIKLLDEKTIPHRKVGKHRRIRVEDVMAYKVAIDREREDVLDQLTREAQEQGLGYERA